MAAEKIFSRRAVNEDSDDNIMMEIMKLPTMSTMLRRMTMRMKMMVTIIKMMIVTQKQEC
jgi:hypothetical protein